MLAVNGVKETVILIANEVVVDIRIGKIIELVILVAIGDASDLLEVVAIITLAPYVMEDDDHEDTAYVVEDNLSERVISQGTLLLMVAPEQLVVATVGMEADD